MKRASAFLAIGVLLTACAGPPLTLYTLSPDASPPASSLAPRAVIVVARVNVPDALDTQDILVRDGATMKRSARSRWAERLSLGVTDLVTAELAAQNPRDLVTDQPQIGPVTARLAINISTLDITAAGDIKLAADWTFTPTDPHLPPLRARTRIVLHMDVSTDANVVGALQRSVVMLAQHIQL